MPLVPLRNKVVGSLIQGIAAPSSLILPYGDSRKKIPLAMKVEAVGPACCEVSVGDTVILPEGNWTLVTLLEDGATDTSKKVAILEQHLLAKVL